jgi:hypothetical protein
MFNLETAIAEWRKQMRAEGIKTPVPLEELENHLREDFEAQIRSGAIPERAFEIAAGRLGPAAAIQQEFSKVGKVMSARARRFNFVFSAVVAVLFCVVGVQFLVNIPHAHVAPVERIMTWGERISLAGAFLSAGLLLSTWMFTWRIFPVLPRAQTRIAAVFLSVILSGFCATVLLQFLPPGSGTTEELVIAVAWALLVPLSAAAALIYGLEEAAYRNAQRRAR